MPRRSPRGYSRARSRRERGEGDLRGSQQLLPKCDRSLILCGFIKLAKFYEMGGCPGPRTCVCLSGAGGGDQDRVGSAGATSGDQRVKVAGMTAPSDKHEDSRVKTLNFNVGCWVILWQRQDVAPAEP
ncbi:unnamed protein product [Arctogadus glacialis]